jgi:hypothetical protein
MKHSAVVALLFALAACQTAPAPPTVRSDAAPGTDFATYRTWGFHQPLSADKNGYSTITTERIKVAVEREMLRRGFTASTTPDLYVNFDVTTREAVQASNSPSMGISFGGFSYGGSGGGGVGVGTSTGGTSVKTVTEGTLAIDVVDRERNKLVWGGSVEGTLTKEALQDPEKTIDAAVQAVFREFPRPIVDTGALTSSP